MKAVGWITINKSATGQKLVALKIVSAEGCWTDGMYWLENEEDIPKDNPLYGLFEFEPTDQFCKWIDPNKA
jgi:hypothetical protein